MPRVDLPVQKRGAGLNGRPCEVVPLPYQAEATSYFERIRREPGAVLLDSGRPTADRGRFDVMSAWPIASFSPEAAETGHEFLLRLRRGLQGLGAAHLERDRAALPFAGGLMGYLAYEFGRRLEKPVGSGYEGGSGHACLVPDAQLGLYDWALITDHALQTSQLVFHPSCSAARREMVERVFKGLTQGRVQEMPGGAEATSDADPAVRDFLLEGPFQARTDRDAYRQAIVRIHAYIEAGDCYQVNYTQQFEAPYRGDPWQAYRALRRACPTPFAGYLNLGGNNALLSLSPERFMRLKARQIEARPIKGTRPRGATLEEDRMQALALQESTKDRAENLMIVDLLRNDIGRSSRVGSVRVPELFNLESYPNVHHLVSSVTAELDDGLDAFDLLAGSFPGGSITGAPKLRAMQIIDELEPHSRSVYCGSLLYIDVRGDMDSSITIRTLLAQDGRIRCWGGGGVVMDSEWESEYQESLDKVAVLLRTLEAHFHDGHSPR